MECLSPLIYTLLLEKFLFLNYILLLKKYKAIFTISLLIYLPNANGKQYSEPKHFTRPRNIGVNKIASNEPALIAK